MDKDEHVRLALTNEEGLLEGVGLGLAWAWGLVEAHEEGGWRLTANGRSWLARERGRRARLEARHASDLRRSEQVKAGAAQELAALGFVKWLQEQGAQEVQQYRVEHAGQALAGIEAVRLRWAARNDLEGGWRLTELGAQAATRATSGQ